jgi:bacteriocin-like protein
MQSKESKAAPPENAPLLALTDKELAAISGGCSSYSSEWNVPEGWHSNGPYE